MIKKLFDWILPGGYSRYYRRGRRIFAGPFSEIFLAVRKKDEKEVALKVLTESGEEIARKLDEAEGTQWEGELLTSLEHPNIVEGFECGTTGPYWVAMEYIEQPLNSYIGRCNNAEEEDELLRILYEIASAIAYLHNQNLVHRDLAVDNIMLKDNRVKLIDFGMAVPVDSEVGKGRVGTPSYMAPEMIKRREFTPGGDVYSFGIIMYELITGQKPFKGEMRETRMTKSLNLNPTPPSRLEKYCSKEVEELLMRCVSKDPAERPDDGAEVVSTLFLIRRKRGLM